MIQDQTDNTARRNVLRGVRSTALSLVTSLQGDVGRPESAELTLAMRKFQEGAFWIREHLEQLTEGN